MPATLIKTVYEKQFIAMEAKKACEFCAKGGAQALPESIDALTEGFKEVKNLPLAEQSAFFLQELVKKIPKEYFISPSDSLRGLLEAAGNEALAKRMKLKKAAIAILTDFQQHVKSSGMTLDQALQGMAYIAPDKTALICKEVEDSANSKKPQAAEKSKDFRSFLKQQKQHVSQ